MMSASRRLGDLDQAVSLGASIDRRLKTGRIRQPEDALRSLMLALAADVPQRQTGRPR